VLFPHTWVGNQTRTSAISTRVVRFLPAKSNFDIRECDLDTQECYFYTQNAIFTGWVRFSYAQVRLPHAASYSYTHELWIWFTRVLFLDFKCDFHTQNAFSTRGMRFLLAVSDFDIYECDFDMHECYFYTQSAIFICTSETSTCSVLFLHTWVVNLTHRVLFLHEKCDFNTKSTIFTRRVWFWHPRVWYRHARVLFLHAECNIHTQSAIFIRLKIHLFLRLYCTHCTHSLICSFMSIRKKQCCKKIV
jgi:hypothetical protein